MLHYVSQDDDLTTDSHFLMASTSKPRKSPSRRNNLHLRPVVPPRTPSNLASVIDNDSLNGHHHSLAHELAVALMPEPSAGSKLLAEEFGIDYDDSVPPSFADEMHAVPTGDASFNGIPVAEPEEYPQKEPEPEHDAMEVLAQDLHSTDKFLGHLRKLDIDPGSLATQQQPVLEKLASDVIRRMNETVRSREAQVREIGRAHV